MHALRDQPAVVLPSFLQCDFGNLQREVERLEEAGIKAFHLDVMDGHFVPNLSYGMPIVAAVRKLTKLPLDVHLMISSPEKYIPQFVDAGADCLTIHAEIDSDVPAVLTSIRSAGVLAGLAVNPGTPLQMVQPILSACDLLLIMSVDAGFGGQAFNPIALDKLRLAKEIAPHLLLEVDGGVNRKTIASCREAGASLFVVGSAIFGQDDYLRALGELADAME
ncbi:MAG: ribulose-phosphate 3-epimerase [Pirellulaceae bacterium]|nr:ribulose-phosphate 3-epimerase [Pirellulaceae bacterium]